MLDNNVSVHFAYVKLTRKQCANSNSYALSTFGDASSRVGQLRKITSSLETDRQDLTIFFKQVDGSTINNNTMTKVPLQTPSFLFWQVVSLKNGSKISKTNSRIKCSIKCSFTI